MLDQHSSDNWNPVFWKELHLMHQSRMLLLMPLLAGCIDVLFLVGLSYLRSPHDSPDLFLGNFNQEGLCAFYYILMALVALGWVAVQVLTTTSGERNVEGLDPLLGTQLTAGQVLAGKLMTILVCVGVVTLLEVPFFLYVGRLEWVDFMAFGVLALLLLAASAWLVMLGNLSHPGGGNKTVTLSQFFCGLALLPMAFCYVIAMIHLGVRPADYSNDYMGWRIMLTLVLVSAVVFAYAASISLAMLRNTRQERSWTWRLCTLVVWLALPGVIYLIWRRVWKDEVDFRMVQALMGYGLSALTAGFCLFERIVPSRRTLQQAAGENWLAKILTLPFRSGVAPGLVLAWLLYLVSVVLQSGCSVDDQEFLAHCQACTGYALLYSPLAALISDRWHAPRELICAIFAAVICFLPLFASIIGLDFLSCPSVGFVSMAAFEQIPAVAIVVTLIAVVPGTIAAFKYCSKFFQR